MFAGPYENRVIVAAAAPIFGADGKQVIGVIQLAQTADRWLTLRDRALTRLLNLTLFVTLFAVGAAFWFAGRMTLRISRLGAASETALSREGSVSRVLPEERAKDELGDLSRSFSSLLGRLDEYTGYLRTLAGKLAHEIRTPLTIIRSSLENLESEAQSIGYGRGTCPRAQRGHRHPLRTAEGALRAAPGHVVEGRGPAGRAHPQHRRGPRRQRVPRRDGTHGQAPAGAGRRRGRVLPPHHAGRARRHGRRGPVERVNKAIASFIRLGWIDQSDRRYRITNREQLERRAR